MISVTNVFIEWRNRADQRIILSPPQSLLSYSLYLMTSYEPLAIINDPKKKAQLKLRHAILFSEMNFLYAFLLDLLLLLL